MKRATGVLLGFWALWFLFAYMVLYSESNRLSELMKQSDNFITALSILFAVLLFLILGTLGYARSDENRSRPKNTTDDTWRIITETTTTTTEKEKEDKHPLTDKG